MEDSQSSSTRKKLPRIYYNEDDDGWAHNTVVSNSSVFLHLIFSEILLADTAASPFYICENWGLEEMK